MDQHICTSWQGFIQQAITLISHGYHLYCKTVYPENKREKWHAIDSKLIEKYGADVGKDKRYRNKLKGQANHVFLRWENCALLLRSTGNITVSDDIFVNILKEPLIFAVGEIMKIKIVSVGSRGRVTAYIEKTVYRQIKAELLELCSHRHVEVLKNRFSALNGLPAHSGITQQKSQIVTEIIQNGKKHGLKLSRKDFPILTRKKVYKVFD